MQQNASNNMPIQASHKLKEQGNNLFKQGEFKKAIRVYGEAINLNPEEPVFFLNRAKCHKQLEDFEKMAEDAKEAINRDPKYTKAFLTLGEALIEMGKADDETNKKCEDGLKHLRKAKSLCSSNPQTSKFEAEIINQLMKA
jgi:tetratricopeptide (TPR) repeat protein